MAPQARMVAAWVADASRHREVAAAGEGVAMTERCETCRYWELSNLSRYSSGSCRRYPPQCEPRVSVAAWPMTYAEKWCGEWRKLERDPMAPDQR